jgi:hypothetical protein
MFGSRGRGCRQMVTVLALTVLTGCGAAGTPAAALGSGSISGRTDVPLFVSATTAASTATLTGTTGNDTAAIATALSVAQNAIAARSTGAQAVTSTAIRSSAVPATASTSARSAAAAGKTGGNVTQALTFSGDLSGSFTSTAKPDLCGKKDQDFGGTTIHHTFGVGLIQGKINGETYGLAFTVDNYHGPDTYKDAAVVSLANPITQDVLLNLVNNATVVVIAPGETSGTILSDVKTTPPSKEATVHIAGTWRCS